jgi:hypothetical protein
MQEFAALSDDLKRVNAGPHQHHKQESLTRLADLMVAPDEELSKDTGGHHLNHGWGGWLLYVLPLQ